MLCGHHTKVPLDKPKSAEKTLESAVPEIEIKPSNIKTKKKKKPKNKMAEKPKIAEKMKPQPMIKKPVLKKVQQPNKKPVISATKQNNQLLKLAEMLKKSNNSSSSNPLNKLLK